MIYALLSQNFVVEIYALFPQNILDWGADSANFFAFWMYGARFICVQSVIDKMFQGDSLFWDTRTKTADLPLVPEDFFEKDDAAKEEAREGVEEPKEGRELKIARRRLTAAMRNFTVADFTPDR